MTSRLINLYAEQLSEKKVIHTDKHSLHLIHLLSHKNRFLLLYPTLIVYTLLISSAPKALFQIAKCPNWNFPAWRKSSNDPTLPNVILFKSLSLIIIRELSNTLPSSLGDKLSSFNSPSMYTLSPSLRLITRWCRSHVNAKWNHVLGRSLI